MLGIKEIEEIIPHRHPFLLIDYIEDFKPGEFAVGYKLSLIHISEPTRLGMISYAVFCLKKKTKKKKTMK